MFDLFLALFGGAYYAARIGSEKSEHKQMSRLSDERIRQRKTNFDNWISTMVDEELEYNISKKLKCRPEEVFAEIVDDINELDLYQKSISSYSDFLSEAHNSGFYFMWEDKIPIRMLMAKRGKLLKDDAWFSFRSPGIWNYEEKQKWIRHHKFMLWLDRELQSHGVEPMQFVAGAALSDAKYTGIGQQLTDIKNPIGGTYFWSPSAGYMRT